VSSPLASAIDGYAALGKSLVERWNAHASAVAARVDSGSYDADHAVADLAQCVTLACESGMALVSEALDAVAVVSAPRGPVFRESYPFACAAAGAALTLTGPLVNMMGTDRLTEVTIVPAQLGPNQTEFRLRANATGKCAGLYIGSVRATGVAQAIPVRIVIP
jgi:hypothetical protein